MAQKKFFQNFAADYIGIDGESTPLEEDSGGANRAVNYEQAVGNSLRGRVGIQIAGSPTGFMGILPHVYTRTQDQYDIVYDSAGTLSTTKTSADGASIRKLIGLNKQVWVRDTMTVPVTIQPAHVGQTFTWYTYVSGSNINLKILRNGVSVLDTSLGNGTTSFVSIYSLLDTINAASTYFAISRTTRGTCFPYAQSTGGAIVATGSATYGTYARIPMTAHNFNIGDLITFVSPTSANGFNNLHGGVVIAINTAGTNIDYVGDYTYQPGVNEICGYMAQSAAAIEISPSQSTTGGTLNLQIPYFRLILEGDYPVGFAYDASYSCWYNKTDGSFFTPPTSTDAQGALYIAASTVTASAPYNNYLCKTDGISLYRAGLPAPTTAIVENASGVGVLNAGETRRYKAYLKRVDAQGNIIEGPLSNVIEIKQAALSYNAVTISGNLYSNSTGFQGRSCFSSSTKNIATSATTIPVDNGSGGPAFIQPGDPITFMDDVTQNLGLSHFAFAAAPATGDVIGRIHRAYCTKYDGAGATILSSDNSNFTIRNNSEITTGLTVVVLRTAVAGNTYYQLAEVPYTGYSTVSFFDNVTDTTLTSGIQFDEPEIGKEHDAPPACSLVCQHQGGLVVARGFGFPNTVSYSTASGIEYFPTASNSFDVPSTQSGYITAIASDTNDRLAVFKDYAYYDAQGDLDAGAFSVNVKTEGDYGITSHASLVRIKDSLVGLSRLGFITVTDGILDPFRFKELNTRIVNQPLFFGWAVAANDPFLRVYSCTLLKSDGTFPNYVIDYSKPRIKTFERSYPDLMDQVGGMVALGEDFYHLSRTAPYCVFKRLPRFNGDSPTGNNGESFIDNTSAISYIYETNPISNNEPHILNTPVRIRLWSLPNDYVIEGWVPFSLLVEGGSSPLAAYIGSAYNGGISSTVSFATANDIFKDVKVISGKTHFYMVRLTTNTIRTAPFITGFAILYAEDYDAEDFVK